jgi:flagellar motor switch protein FliN/FliY
MTDSVHEMLRSLAARWSELLVEIVKSMTDQTPKANWTEVSGPPADADLFWWEQHLNLGETAVVWAGAPAQSWSELGGRTLRAAGIDTVEEADAKNTYLEILSQSLSGVAQSAGSHLGVEVTCGEGAARPETPSGGHWVSVEIVYDDVTLPGILLGFSPALIDKLEHAGDAAVREEAPAAQTLDLAPPEVPPANVPQSSKTLSLLLDVELPISVSFGRAELLLKDVLKLTTGSIVELNRGVSEPVEVIVNNCVVARGEVVVMDGNYGVRIHHIISPQERLRTLK